MALTAVDRDLLQRCLAKQPGSWNDFVDRFLSLIYHVIHYTAHLRSARVPPEDVEDIAAEVLLQIVADDYKVLRQFKGQRQPGDVPDRDRPADLRPRAEPPADGPRRDPPRRRAGPGRGRRTTARSPEEHGEPGGGRDAACGKLVRPGAGDRAAVLPGGADVRGDQHRDWTCR